MNQNQHTKKMIESTFQIVNKCNQQRIIMMMQMNGNAPNAPAPTTITTCGCDIIRQTIERGATQFIEEQKSNNYSSSNVRERFEQHLPLWEMGFKLTYSAVTNWANAVTNTISLPPPSHPPHHHFKKFDCPCFQNDLFKEIERSCLAWARLVIKKKWWPPQFGSFIPMEIYGFGKLKQAIELYIQALAQSQEPHQWSSIKWAKWSKQQEK